MLRLDFPAVEVVVVDNASPDNSVEIIKAWASGKMEAGASPNPELSALVQPPIAKPARFHFIESSENNGFAAGNNVGIAHALAQPDCGYIWLLNNDTVVPPNALAALVNRWQQAQQAGQKPGIMGSKLRFYDTPELLQGIGSRFYPARARILQVGTLEPDTGQYDDGQTHIDSVIGASIFTSAEFVRSVGPMAENYFLYYEEIDWAERARRAGYSVLCAPQSIVYHKQGVSTGNSVKGKKNPASMFYHYRNLLRFYSKFFPARWPVAAAVVLLRILKRAARGQWGYLKLIVPVFLQRERYP